MKVGYIGRLNLPNSVDRVLAKVYQVVDEAEKLKLDYLICVGGISYNYHLSLMFVEEIGKLLNIKNIKFRFIVGNTDFYYPNEDSASKEIKFKSILREYNKSPFYLPNNPIFSVGTRIQGFETWYDYTLYRGKPVDLKYITKKSMLGILKNKDVKYLTDKFDYFSGIKGTFDYKYCGQTQSRMISKLDLAYNKWGNPIKHNVCVMWFLPSKRFLKNNAIDRYFGTFKGSEKYLDIMSNYHITDCILGTECVSHYPEGFRGIKFLNVSNTIKEVEY